MIELLADPQTWLSLLSLTALEIVLGIDNIVFISILTAKLPLAQQPLARRLGISLALVLRLGLLGAISWVMSLEATLFTVVSQALSGRDLILIGGGLFLIAKATHEIYDKLEGAHQKGGGAPRARSFALVLAQILVLDVVFSLDSVITAVGMARRIEVMVAAMVIAVGVMLASAGVIGGFVNRHPSVKILALSFLLLIGVLLVADGLGQHLGKGYIYSAMAFALLVELLNMRMRKIHHPVTLHRRIENAESPGAEWRP